MPFLRVKFENFSNFTVSSESECFKNSLSKFTVASSFSNYCHIGSFSGLIFIFQILFPSLLLSSIQFLQFSIRLGIHSSLIKKVHCAWDLRTRTDWVIWSTRFSTPKKQFLSYILYFLTIKIHIFAIVNTTQHYNNL